MSESRWITRSYCTAPNAASFATLVSQEAFEDPTDVNSTRRRWYLLPLTAFRLFLDPLDFSRS